MATLELKNLSKTYPNGHQAIKSASLSVDSGEFVVIVGPSGCGKSSLLRMVAGLEGISSGDLLLEGKRINDLAPSDRDIAMVFQNYALYPHMSVFDNMAYGLKIRKMPKADIKSRVGQTAEILGLKELLDRKPKQLSGGQRQRVAMGRAIVRQPKLFLFDEPLSNLDAKLRVQMRLEMQAIHQRLGITSLYVTHDQVEAMTLAQRIVILNGGYIEQVGTPDEIYNQPASTFVAEFIGSPPMNLLSVTLDRTGEIRFEGYHEPFSRINPHHLKPIVASVGQQPVWLGIRPEQLRLITKVSDAQANLDSQSANALSFTAKIVMKEMLGAEVLLYLEVQNQQLILRCGSDEVAGGYQIGEQCQVALNVASLYWFDKNSGKRLVATDGETDGEKAA